MPIVLQVAQEGLSGSGGAGPGEAGGRVRTSGLGSYPEIHVPVYAAVKGVRTADLPMATCLYLLLLSLDIYIFLYLHLHIFVTYL